MHRAEIKIRPVLDRDMRRTNRIVRYWRWMARSLKVLQDEVLRLTAGKVLIWYPTTPRLDDFDDIQWAPASFGGKRFWIPSASWVQKKNDEHDAPNTAVILVIGPERWRDPDFVIGGLNTFETQVIHPSDRWRLGAWKKTIEHELLHSFDNTARRKGIRIEDAVQTNRAGRWVRNWDEDVVHERYPSGEYTYRYDYVWPRIADVLANIYPAMQHESIGSSIKAVQGVFGPQWQPAPVFFERGLVKRGIVGAVRVPDSDKPWVVYLIGRGGRPVKDERDFEKLFGTRDQRGIVGLVSVSQAKRLGITAARSGRGKKA